MENTRLLASSLPILKFIGCHLQEQEIFQCGDIIPDIETYWTLQSKRVLVALTCSLHFLCAPVGIGLYRHF